MSRMSVVPSRLLLSFLNFPGSPPLASRNIRVARSSRWRTSSGTSARRPRRSARPATPQLPASPRSRPVPRRWAALPARARAARLESPSLLRRCRQPRRRHRPCRTPRRLPPSNRSVASSTVALRPPPPTDRPHRFALEGAACFQRACCSCKRPFKNIHVRVVGDRSRWDVCRGRTITKD
ncbi:unnamed protein product [Phaeothamnion confervicola]